MRTLLVVCLGLLLQAPLAQAQEPPVGSRNAVGTRNAYFGDLHIHTRFSLDAFMLGVRRNPDDAYRYAKGEPLMHAAGYPIRLRGAPLDFLGVTDHAFYMGVFSAMSDPNHELSKSPLAEVMIRQDLEEFAATFLRGERDERLYHPDVMRDTWQEEIAAAERHYRPGQFTTFIGYEYTSSPGYNMHRNVIFRGSNVPDLPFSSLESQNPEDLWRWLDEQRALGNEALAIPHNSNWSAGHMFARQQESGEPFDAEYARLRMRNEPIVEMTQVKGTSETHPLLSPNDEWADFEIWNVVRAEAPDGELGTPAESTDLEDIRGGYVRDAYRAGLVFEENEGFNPYRFGMIGSSDSHNAGASYEESSYFSQIGLMDATPERRGSVPAGGAKTWEDGAQATGPLGVRFSAWGASGLAGVWADENTREAIYDAFRRKETFATSGPRIRVRFFAGWDLSEDDLGNDLVTRGYAGGVPMGGQLAAAGAGARPGFLLRALKDPREAPLERLQIVKAWVEDGASHEKIFDVACADGSAPNPSSQRCAAGDRPPDLSDCSYDASQGAGQLSAWWTDPEFEAGQRAFYYVRVLQIPTCRWSTWDANRLGVPRPEDVPAWIQERAVTSPIWYAPDAG